MDDARFDALTRRLAGGLSRRDLLRGLAGLTGVGLFILAGRNGAEAQSCSARCDRLPPGTDRDQCKAACAASDETRARGDHAQAVRVDARR